MQAPSIVRRLLQPAPEDDFGEELALGWHKETFDELTKVTSFAEPFYNPALLVPRDEIALPITWTGFPRYADIDLGPDEALKTRDELFAYPSQPALLRPQQEYLEWRAEKNPRTGKISRITFTCEFEIYFEYLTAYAPEKLVELYRTYVSPKVQLDDLVERSRPGGRASYQKLNKWNTTDGIMHLAWPDNSLAAAIALGRFSALRPNVSNTAPYLTESARLVACGAFGADPNRAADLQIASMLNKLAQTGALVSLKIPIAVYIAHYDTMCVTDSNGVPVPNFWRVLRGQPGIPGDPLHPSRILRLEYAVPLEYGFEIGDLYVDGRPVRYGGQLARHIRMQLIATASLAAGAAPTVHACRGVAYRFKQNHDVLEPVRVGDAPPAGFEPAFPFDSAPSNRPPEPDLELDDIQGNIVVGFNKRHQAIIGIRFNRAENTCAWLQELAPLLTSSVVAYDARQDVRNARVEERAKPNRNDAFVNVAFSAGGLKRLGVSIGSLSRAFVDGQWRRAPSKLGDPVAGGMGAVEDWIVGGSDATTPDAILICAADGASMRDSMRRELIHLALKHALRATYVQDGDDLPALNGVTGREHFGFKDNIAKVRLRGMYPPGQFYNERSPLIPQDPVLPEFCRPGEPLVWPGQILLGYERQSAVDTREPMPADPHMPPWTKNGSYLVFRRLRQNVELFRRFTARAAAELPRHEGKPPSTPAFVAALLVGRWPDGTPLEVSPSRALSIPNPTNDFVYARENWPPGSNMSADAIGERCPVAAHIRKVNPRDQGTDLGPPGENLRRAILRRGIPYGPPLTARESGDTDRGLLFLSYQASIEDTFETITQSWMNSPAAPTPPPGFDMLVGRAPGDSERFCTIAGTTVAITQPFVYATGGGYFFAPSLSAIEWLGTDDRTEWS